MAEQGDERTAIEQAPLDLAAIEALPVEQRSRPYGALHEALLARLGD